MQFGELVCMTAEMMLEQAHLLQLLAQNSRLREELVLSMVRNDTYPANMQEWAKRLGVDLTLPRVAMVVELDSGQLGVSTAMSELQQLQSLLLETSKDDLMAIVSLREMVVLKPAYLHAERWEPEEHKRRMTQLYQRLQQGSPLKVRLALKNFFLAQGWGCGLITRRKPPSASENNECQIFTAFVIRILSCRCYLMAYVMAGRRLNW